MFYNKQTYNNKSSLKRISHTSRYQKSVDILLDLFKSKKINLLDLMVVVMVIFYFYIIIKKNGNFQVMIQIRKL